MKSLNEVIFIDNLPTLDLHGFDRQTACVAINDFIKDNFKMKNEFLVIIHGIGSGVIKNTTIETLRKNKYVKEYKLHYFNDGCTILMLDLTK
jgi:dsDNA-specific endonuclease/ATPase MutS2